MSSNWSALHAQLVRSVNRHSNTARFPELIPQDIAGRSFRDPAQLLEWLHDRRGDPDLRNAVLRALHSSAVSDQQCSTVATELLILALWPGLCLIRGRLRRYKALSQRDADLVSGLSIGILKSDPERVTRVAATLLRNLERDLRRNYVHAARLTLSDTVDAMVELANADQGGERPEDIIKAAQRQLGEDGLLLALVHVAGFNQKDAARGLGITHDAARKRCQRTLVRLKNNFDG